jgi:hypothetical protein
MYNLQIACKKCNGVIAEYDIVSYYGRDILEDGVYCKTCYTAYELDKAKLQTHSIFPIIEKYRKYDREPERVRIVKIFGHKQTEDKYGETIISTCDDIEVCSFIEQLRVPEMDSVELVINKVESEKELDSLHFFMHDIILRATRLKDKRWYLEVVKGVLTIDEYMLYQYRDVKVAI